jgi:HK97 gp10 family phage protein
VSEYVVNWDQEKLLVAIRRRITSGIGKACEFAEGQAKAKAPVRTGLLRSEIAHEVEAEPSAIVGRVGVKAGPAFYGIYQEMGTSRGVPAHPYLRPAVFGNASEIVRLIAQG